MPLNLSNPTSFYPQIYGGPPQVSDGSSSGGPSTAGSAPGSSSGDWLTQLLGSLGTGINGAVGSSNAAAAMVQGDQNAINNQNTFLSQLQGIWSPQATAGNSAFPTLSSQLGLTGTPDYSAFYNSPGFQFAQQQGDQAINRGAAATGNAFSTSTLGALGNYNNGLASQTYQNYIGNLLSTANLGSTANQGLATGTYNTGANISQLMANQGNANASASLGTAGAVNQGLSSLLGPGSPLGSLIGSGLSSLLGLGGSGAAGAGSGIGGAAGGLLNGLKSLFSGGGSNTSATDPYSLTGGSNNPYTAFGGNPNSPFNNNFLGYDPTTGTFTGGTNYTDPNAATDLNNMFSNSTLFGNYGSTDTSTPSFDTGNLNLSSSDFASIDPYSYSLDSSGSGSGF